MVSEDVCSYFLAYPVSLPSEYEYRTAKCVGAIETHVSGGVKMNQATHEAVISLDCGCL